MPTWDEILLEMMANVQPGNLPDMGHVHQVRRKYLAEYERVAGRPAIFYYSAFLSGNGGSVNLEDVQGLMVVFKGIGKARELDLILHSPGGEAEAADSIVKYIRKKFDHVRVLVPLAAMSAATMLALSGDEIVMGSHSQLGPIDPQVGIGGGQYSTRSIIQQFRQAVDETSKNPNAILAWSPLLQRIGPGLLPLCERAEALSKSLVKQWLKAYMLKSLPTRQRNDRANRIVKFFSDYGAEQSHGLGIDRDQARSVGLTVSDLEGSKTKNGDLQEALLSAHHACLHAMQFGQFSKLIANHSGKAFLAM